MYKCTKCNTSKSSDLFYSHNTKTCKECVVKRQQEYNKKRKVKTREYVKKYAKTEKGAYNLRKAQLKKYGMLPEDYDFMLTEQKGRCAICLEKSDILCVDHNHITGQVRELLCVSCNTAIGHLKSDEGPTILERALAYTKKWN